MINYLASFVNTDGSSFPDTAAVNSSGPGTTDGTEFVKAMIDDIWGANQALLNYTGDSPDGNSEADGASQRLDSILKIVSNTASTNATGTYTVEEWNKRGILLLQAGVATITLAAGVGCDETNHILILNQSGGSVTIDYGSSTHALLNGEVIEYLYNTGTTDFEDVTGRSLKKDQNLNDLPNKATARTNLDVYSKADSRKVSIKQDTASYTILDNDGYDVIEMTISTAARAVTLPTLADNIGRVITIKLISTATNPDYFLTIDGEGAETIEGVTTFILNGNKDFCKLYNNGTEWKVLDFQASYETGWINRSDWTNVHLGSVTTKNTDSNLEHNLNKNLKELGIYVLISSDGTDTNSFRVESTFSASASGTEGYQYNQVDANNIIIQTGSSGILILQADGTYQTLDTDDWYYKIIVRRIKI